MATERILRVAVDVGGTFTDATLFDGATGKLWSAKAFTTPADRSVGVLDAIAAALGEAGAAPEAVREVAHGSTTGTNALIERTGARTGLLVTEGFRDVLEIGRVMRPEAGVYDMSVDRPPPLVSRGFVSEAAERMDAHGAVVRPLDPESVRAAARRFAELGAEAVAVCLLHAYRSPAHECEAGEILAQLLPDVSITLSHRVSPEHREYERASTAVMNAYLTPVMRAYLDRLEPRLADALGPEARLFVIQANGGATTVAAARERALTTVNSGPAGGVVAAAWYGRTHDRKRIVSVDMGGTSFDIGLVEDGRSRITTEGAFQGLPVKIPIIDLHIIGAGGGSVAWVDPGGALAVGPRSAGAEPGPAAYGRGGTAPTVTDANLVLGRLDPDRFHGGRTRLDVEAARRAITRVAEPLGMGIEEAALGIVRVVNANMARGIAAVTIQRGIDPRDFSLLSFGGAGGLHAVDLARELDMAEAVIPPFPGVFSALGLLVADLRRDAVTPWNARADRADPAAMEAAFAAMEAEARVAMAADGVAAAEIRFERSADMKVVGQTYEIRMDFPPGATIDRAAVDGLTDAFAALYRERYAFFFEGEPVEIVALRLTAFGGHAPIALERFEPDPGAAEAARLGERPVWFAGGPLATTVYDRRRLRPGATVAGPAILEEPTSVTLLPPRTTGEIADDLGVFVRTGAAP